MTQKLLAFILLGSFLAPTVALAEPKLAVVDLQRALEETEDGKKAKAKLKADFDRKQQELDAKQDELKKIKEDLDKKLPLMKPEAADAEKKKFQDRFVELQQTYQRLQQDLAKKEQDATSGIFRKLSTVVGTIAEREHFAMVLEKNSAVVWSQPALDITNEVIRLYNTGAKKGK
ncbi:MAG: OmpH family outer membrane protein [Polyangia bacterium]|jgi:outer membrane protein